MPGLKGLMYRGAHGRESSVRRVTLAFSLAIACLALAHTAEAPRQARESPPVSVWICPRDVNCPADQLWRATVSVGVRNMRAVGGDSIYVRRSLWASAPGFGTQGPLAVRGVDSSGRPLEYTGPVAKLARLTSSDFLLLKPRYCYGNEVSLVSLFADLRRPGTYRLWFRYVNAASPPGLPHTGVFVGATAEAACSVHVQ